LQITDPEEKTAHMNLNELLNIKARKNPDSQLNLLVSTAIISIAWGSRR